MSTDIAVIESTITYNPKEHLATIKTKEGLKPYYPAAWRLYELRLRYPGASIEADIVHMDPERNFVIIRARIFDGPNYETSERKASAMKQGLLSELDKVETKAKAMAARDYGIGTEYALDFDTGCEDETEVTSTLAKSTVVSEAPVKVVEAAKPAPAPNSERLNAMYKRGLSAGNWSTRSQFLDVMSRVLEQPITRANVGDINDAQLDLVEEAMLEPAL